MPTSHAIVACARSWIGTRFHHQGRLKKTAAHKGGVDCLGLLAGVATELNLQGGMGFYLASADETDYSHQPDSARLRKRLSELLVEIPITPSPLVGEGGVGGMSQDNVQSNMGMVSPLPNPPPQVGREMIGQHMDYISPGDVVLLNIDGNPQHLAIVSDDADGLGIIHAYAPAKAVVEHHLDEWWRGRIKAAFRVVENISQ